MVVLVGCCSQYWPRSERCAHSTVQTTDHYNRHQETDSSPQTCSSPAHHQHWPLIGWAATTLSCHWWAGPNNNWFVGCPRVKPPAERERERERWPADLVRRVSTISARSAQIITEQIRHRLDTSLLSPPQQQISQQNIFLIIDNYRARQDNMKIFSS